MKTKKWYFIPLTLLAGIFILNSCEMDKTAINEEDLVLAEEDALTEVVFDDLMESVDNAIFYVEGKATGGLKSMIDSGNYNPQVCPEITVDHPDLTTFPKVITIDWGDGCDGFYGQTRSGMVKITLTGWMHKEGSKKTIELIDYFINSIKVEGTKTTMNEGRNENGNLVFSSVLVGGKLIITNPDSSAYNQAPNTIEITKEFERDEEWVEGEETRYNHFDNVFYITGTAEGTNPKQEAYTRTITYRLEKRLSCKFIVSGTVEIVVGDKPVITLDYGNGECDNKATITVNGESKEILLKHRHRYQIRNRPK